MATYLVTRHEGTRIWATAASKLGRLPFTIDQVVEHLDPSRLAKGDMVVGTVPLAVAAELEDRGVQFWALDLDLPQEDRGKELGPTRLYKLYETLGARFTRYKVRRKESATVEGNAKKARPPQPDVSLIPVSEQLAPAAITWLHQPTAQVFLLASPGMKERARVLRDWLQKLEQPPKVVMLDWDDAAYESLFAQAEEWAGKLAAESRPAVVVQLTGGTKPMAMALQRAFGKRGESFARRLSGPYVDTGRKRIEDLLAHEPSSMPMRSVLNVRDLLALQGIEAKAATSSHPDYQRWLGRDKLYQLLRDKLASSWLGTWYQVLERADWLLNSRKNRKDVRTAGNDLVGLHWDGSLDSPAFEITSKKPEQFGWKSLQKALAGGFGSELRKHGVAAVERDTRNDGKLRLSMNREGLDELAFLSGVWMEVWLAKKFSEAGVDDWVQGLTIAQGKVKNELDLVVANGNRLLLIEVKTGQLDRDGKTDSKATEVVYKLDSLAEKLGRYLNDRWLVSLKPLSDQDRARADTHRIKVFDGENLARLDAEIREWVEKTSLPRDPSLRPAFPVAKANAAPGWR